MSDYRITQQDVDTMVHIMEALRPDSPEKHEPAYCLALLEYLKANIGEKMRNIALENPDRFEAIVDEYENSLTKE